MKVYLYELDSVRNTAAEIELAQNRLFEETVGNGNTVVLSLNQLLDGMGFTGALYGDKGDENYQTILKLFQSELVKVCKFTDPDTKETVETLAKYWLKNMGKKHFIVSGIELSPERKADMKAVLEGKRNKDILDKWDDAGTEKEKADARYVQRVVNLILELDYNVKNIWVDEETKEKRVNFDDLLDFFLENAHSRILLRSDPNVQKALDVLYLASLKITDRNQRQYRSIWYRTLKVEGNGFLDVPAVLNIAKYIIDLCYNVSVESGISGIKLPYEANGSDKEKIREQQSRHVLVTLANYLEPTTTMPTLRLPPWEDALETIKEVGTGKKAFRTWLFFGSIYLMILAGMYFVVFPSLDTVLDLVSPHKGVTLLLSLVVSTFADWIIGKIAKTKDNIWETLKKLIKFLYKEVQIDNYLERAGLFSRISRKIKESVTDRLTKHAERKDADQP